MTTQPKALRLAECVEKYGLGDDIAVELRRLHAENERYGAECLKLAQSWNDAESRCDALLEALKAVEPILTRMYGSQAAELPPMQIVRAAIAKANSADL